MKKTLIISALVIAVIAVVFFAWPKPSVNPGQIVVRYSSATNTSKSCAANTSTILVAQSENRVSFKVTNGSATSAISMCQATTCTATSGITLNASGGSFEQTDNYTGAYSCTAVTATTSVGVISQQ